MAAGNLLALIDDIATVLDDVALLSKLAAKKTAGVLGDDLALNAQQVSGVRADRELPVVWAVARGSFFNKAVLVPAALAISALAPWLVTPLLMLGGAYLCFEGFEKLAHRWIHPPAAAAAADAADAAATASPTASSVQQAVQQPPDAATADLVALERDKIKGAVRTDFILSAEIIAITLGTVAQAPFTTQLLVLAGVALAMTVGVYGLVAGIVKLDDLGLWLTHRASSAAQAAGTAILWTAPWLMKGLSVAGTAAMFLVGGGILVHGVPPLAHAIEAVVAGWAASAAWLALQLANAAVGLGAGAAVLAGVVLVQRLGHRGAA